MAAAARKAAKAKAAAKRRKLAEKLIGWRQLINQPAAWQ